VMMGEGRRQGEERTGQIATRSTFCNAWKERAAIEDGKEVQTISHRKGSRSSSILGLDDLVATELNALDELGHLGLVGEDVLRKGGLGLREEGDDGHAGVTPNNLCGREERGEGLGEGGMGKRRKGGKGGQDRQETYRDGVWLRGDMAERRWATQTQWEAGTRKRTIRSLLRVPSNLGDKGRRTNDIKGGDSKEFLLVVGSGSLEDLGEDGDGRVDGVGDDEDEGFWAVLGDAFGEVSAD
jgi:hypothetical protein